MTTNNKPNRLAKEKSPYLLQHKYNPVDWFPWSEEAFAKSKRENKPIFLSIGYSTCHWCHVMERESFEDNEVAELLNRNYISIKVDREERPDVDHLYMAVCQAMTGQGGWPLTIIMAPDRKPFFAGTYFPKDRKYGRMGMMQLLPQIAEKWKEDTDKVKEIGSQIAEETAKRMIHELEGEVSEETLTHAYENYSQSFDSHYGGFGSAPKFPTSHNLSFLLRYYKKTGIERALEMAETTLDAMFKGGIYDHIGFGFARYSTDERWLVPHFEKMLYDNAMLAITYTEAYQLTGKEKYAEVVRQIFTYILRDMTDPGGAFYSAEDADSEGVEGKFYVWTPDEVLEVLGDEEGELYCQLYDITEKGNFEEHNIPNLLHHNAESFARLKKIPYEEMQIRIEASRQKLFEHRERRIHPHKDDKILTSWNGLMIAAFAIGAKAFQNASYVDSAKKAVDFILRNLRRQDGRLLARFRDGEAAFSGYIDDYAFLCWGLIELYEATFELKYLQLALELNEDMIKLFWDHEKGGFFFYGDDSEQLFTRMKEIYDGAIPSGNSVAALNLQRLARFTGSAELEQLAEKQIKAFAGAVERYPSGHSVFMTAINFAFGPSREIVISGNREHEEMKKMVESVQTRFLPNTIIVLNPDGEEGEAVQGMLPVVQGKQSADGKPAAYVCQNFACQSPVDDAASLVKLL